MERRRDFVSYEDWLIDMLERERGEAQGAPGEVRPGGGDAPRPPGAQAPGGGGGRGGGP